MDISSEIVHNLLPVYLVTILGTGAQTVGMSEGVAKQYKDGPTFSGRAVLYCRSFRQLQEILRSI